MIHAARAALLAALVLLGLNGCDRTADPGAVAEPTGLSSRSAPAVAPVLAPWEAAAWPRAFAGLDLPRDRDYVVLAYLPPAVAVNLASPATMRATVVAGLSDPLATVAAKTKLGHSIVGWQCGATQGVTSFTGESDGQGLEMLLGGWGVAAMLSTFTDGHLYTEAGFNRRHDLALRAGKAVVTAVEVTRPRCEALRGALRRFVTAPNKPAQRFGLLLDPARLEGGGCLSFAWYLAAAAGVLDRARPLLYREVAVHAAMVGAGGAPPPGVMPWRPTGAVLPTPRPVPALLATPWDRGPVVDRVRIPDGEAFLAALVAMRRGVAPADDWRFARVLPARDPAIGHAGAAGAAFAARFPLRRIADPGGVQALVLELEARPG